ncbi:microcin C ABC transporter permease YejB [Aquirhabdus sp.]|uniref:microcin C ABC transporter permease YejB n=1 Tax=Aquirhabdus sp. TaxID=2824160 RepID=UPI00396C5960
MTIYIFKRLLLIIPTLFLILLTNFVIVQMAPGGPVEQAIERAKFDTQGLGHVGELSGEVGKLAQSNQAQYLGARGLSPEIIQQIKTQYGFDQSATERFWMMIKQYASLNFGTSFFKDKPVIQLIIDKLPVTISLGLWSTLLIYAVSIPLGIKKAVSHGGRFDQGTALLLVVGNAIPMFIFAILLIVFFSGGSYLHWFPLQGLMSENFDQLSFYGKIKDYFWHMMLPLIAMTIGGFAAVTYLVKFSFVEELSKPYVLTARAKGLTMSRVLYRHVFQNAILVLIARLPETLLGIVLTGNLLIEIVFNLDGIGLLGFEAIQQRDYPVIFGILFIYTLVQLLFRLMSDLLYRWIDPRIDFNQQGLL